MFNLPEWTFEFHGHKCPFMPIGYRMGKLALNVLGIEKSRNHEMHVFSEMGIGHPQGCMQDGIMASTGATYGKGMIEKLYLGKVAAIFWYPGKEPIRIVLRNRFQDKLAPHEFFKFRKEGKEPTDIPDDVLNDIINIVLTATDEEMFRVTQLPNFTYLPVQSSFNKAKCEECGEYVFERYLRKRNGKTVCISCAGYHNDEPIVNFSKT
jgi:formylmethanofuran dehydrogenase subunit E